MDDLLLSLGSLSWKGLADAAFTFWKNNLKRFFLPVFLLLLVGYIPVHLAQYHYARTISNFPMQGGEGDALFDLLLSMGTMLGTLFLYLILTGLSYFFLCHLLFASLRGEKTSPFTALKLSLTMRNVGTLLLFSIIVGAGFMLCFFPGLYLLLIFSLFVPVMVEEGLSGWSALRRSNILLENNPAKRLTSSPLFQLGVTLTAAWAVGTGLRYLAAVPSMAFGFYIALKHAGVRNPQQMITSMEYVLTTIVGDTIMIAMTALYLVLVLTVLTFFYVRLKNRREGYDLETMLRRHLD